MGKSVRVRDAIQALRKVNIVIRSTYGEYRVNFAYGDEDTAYYTPSIVDAYNTGLDMAKRAGL